MIALLDTDILIDVALDREPFSLASAAVLDSAEQSIFNSFIAWHSIANFSYIVESKSDKFSSKKFIADLLKFVDIAQTNKNDALYALSLSVPDFEDALQIAAARACKADWIVTRNLKHYKKSPVPAIDPAGYLNKLRNQG